MTTYCTFRESLAPSAEAYGAYVCVVCGMKVSAPAMPLARCRIALPKPLPPPPTHGPGTELSKLLKRFGIEPTPTCACRAKAAEMDAWGCDECEKPERIAEVVAVMRAEAEARGLPFLDVAGRLLVRRAIQNARRNA
jgi:hypothetical protein